MIITLSLLLLPLVLLFSYDNIINPGNWKNFSKQQMNCLLFQEICTQISYDQFKRVCVIAKHMKTKKMFIKSITISSCGLAGIIPAPKRQQILVPACKTYLMLVHQHTSIPCWGPATKKTASHAVIQKTSNQHPVLVPACKTYLMLVCWWPAMLDFSAGMR